MNIEPDQRYLVYVESSVISYLTAADSKIDEVRLRQEETRRWWGTSTGEFAVSAVVLDEIGHGDPAKAAARLAAVASLPVLPVTDEAREIADLLIAEKVIPAGEHRDALHVATATVNGAVVLATWNFKHIASEQATARIDAVLWERGYRSPRLQSPRTLLMDAGES